MTSVRGAGGLYHRCYCSDAAAADLLCIPQRRRIPCAAYSRSSSSSRSLLQHLPCHKTHHLSTIATSPPNPRPLLSRLHTKGKQRLFSALFIPQTMQRARRGITTPPFNPTAPKAFPAQLCVYAACTPRGSPRRRGIVGKRGGPVSMSMTAQRGREV